MEPDLEQLEAQLESATRDADALVAGLTETQAHWRAASGSWSVSECLDHLATTNRVYLAAMQKPAVHARQTGPLRRGPATPGLLGRWFIQMSEPPVRPAFRVKAPKVIEPRQSPGLCETFEGFTSSQQEVTAFLREYADLDLASIRFANPFLRGVRFSLATGLHIIAVHERRHLWQAWRVRKAEERSVREAEASDRRG